MAVIVKRTCHKNVPGLLEVEGYFFAIATQKAGGP
jgi:hypothetical protein|tara:strand:- start:1621 stop:1725 length:105 start_codon:yes stop_codon:yes gene_type:complete